MIYLFLSKGCIREVEEIMRILGIDPGYAIMGWAVIDMKGNHFTAVDYDSIMTDAGTPMPSGSIQRTHVGDRAVQAGGSFDRGAVL